VNLPAKLGDRYLCFVLVKEDRGYDWTGRFRPRIWQCAECGYELKDYRIRFDGQPRRVPDWEMKQAADHHECGHAPCAACGQMLLRRKDGTPRQHAHNRCPGKGPGHKIEREFVRNMTAREYV